jgi:hypothetical protein
MTTIKRQIIAIGGGGLFYEFSHGVRIVRN